MYEYNNRIGSIGILKYLCTVGTFLRKRDLKEEGTLSISLKCLNIIQLYFKVERIKNDVTG